MIQAKKLDEFSEKIGSQKVYVKSNKEEADEKYDTIISNVTIKIVVKRKTSNF